MITITITITGESAHEVLSELARLAGNSELSSTTIAAPINEVADAKADTKTTKSRGSKSKEETAKEDVKTVETPAGFTLEDLQELNAKVDDKTSIKKLVNSFFFTNDAGEDSKCERMTQIEKKDYTAYAGGVKLLIDNQV